MYYQFRMKHHTDVCVTGVLNEDEPFVAQVQKISAEALGGVVNISPEPLHQTEGQLCCCPSPTEETSR